MAVVVRPRGDTRKLPRLWFASEARRPDRVLSQPAEMAVHRVSFMSPTSDPDGALLECALRAIDCTVTLVIAAEIDVDTDWRDVRILRIGSTLPEGVIELYQIMADGGVDPVAGALQPVCEIYPELAQARKRYHEALAETTGPSREICQSQQSREH